MVDMSLEAMIKRRHSRTYGWRVVFEVPLWTPDEPESYRIADAIAISSREIHGFEVKSTKWNLCSELATPKKSEPFRMACTAWWLVCDREIIEDMDAVPDGWGILCPSDKGELEVVRDAPRADVKSISLEMALGLLVRREADLCKARKETKFAEILMTASTDFNARVHIKAMEGKPLLERWRIANGFAPVDFEPGDIEW